MIGWMIMLWSSIGSCFRLNEILKKRRTIGSPFFFFIYLSVRVTMGYVSKSDLYIPICLKHFPLGALTI